MLLLLNELVHGAEPPPTHHPSPHTPLPATEVGKATLEQLRALAPRLPCCKTVDTRWNLRRVLAGEYCPAELCRRPGVSRRPSMLPARL